MKIIEIIDWLYEGYREVRGTLYWWAQKYYHSRCNDCRVRTFEIDEYYMVHDSVWWEAGFHPEELNNYLCIGCLEERLGRTLSWADFTGCPLNLNNGGHFKKSDRLKDRLSRLS